MVSKNTQLGSKLLGDALVALGVTFGISPFLTVIDKAIVESAAGTTSILASCRTSLYSIARQPLDYIKSPTFLLMWGVYGLTYTTANAFKTLEEHVTYNREYHRQQALISPGTQDETPSTHRSNSRDNSNSTTMFTLGAFLGTTLVNSGSSMIKDRAYAKMFSSSATSTSTTPRNFPKATYALWMLRDFSVIGSSFLLPDLVATRLLEHGYVGGRNSNRRSSSNQEGNGEGDRDILEEKERVRQLLQLGLPVVAQVIAGPLQYVGLDLYNRNLDHLTTPQAVADRAKHVARGVLPVIGARIARIVPGYSLGGVANTHLRTMWRDQVQQWKTVPAMLKKNSSSSSSSSSIILRQ